MNKMRLEEFRDEGYLQECNRQFFHPLGLSLVVVDGEYMFIDDDRDDPEGVMFHPPDLERAKFENIKREWVIREGHRRSGLGWMTQPFEDTEDTNE